MKRLVCMIGLALFAVLLVSRDAEARKMGREGTLEGYVQKTIQFADKNLEVAVRNALRIGDGEEFGEADCLKLTKLKAYNLGISSIKGIEKCINIEHLDLGKNQIEDISFIFSLKKLKVLDLTLNKIKDFSPIYALTELVDLDLDYTGFNEMIVLKTLTKLTSLRVAGNKIDDIGVLVDNDGLGEGDYVDLRDNDLSFDDLNDVLALHNRGVKVDNDPLFDIPAIDENPLDENGPKPDHQDAGIQPFDQPDEDVVTFDCSAPLKMELKDAKVMTIDQRTIEFANGYSFDGYASTVKFYKYFDYEVFNAKFAPSGGSGIFKYEYLPAATEHWNGPYFGQIEVDDIQSASEVTVKATDIVCKTSISKTVKFEKSCYSNEYKDVTVHIKLDTFGEDADADSARMYLRLKSGDKEVAKTDEIDLDKNDNDIVDDESPKFKLKPTSDAENVCLGDVDVVNVVVNDVGNWEDADIYYSEILVHAPNLPMPYNYWHCEPDGMFETTCAGSEWEDYGSILQISKREFDGVDYDLNGWSTVNPANESEWPDEPGKIY